MFTLFFLKVQQAQCELKSDILKETKKDCQVVESDLCTSLTFKP